jgi:outer membrane autotransporter protein
MASSSFGFTGLRGGLLAAVGEDLSLGAVIEGGHWGWTLNDKTLPEHLSGDSVRGGAFLNWMAGPWRLNFGAFLGSQQVRSTASSTLGGGASRAAYDADVYGLGGEAGYPVAMGDWTLTPLVGVSWLGWSSPAFTETGGIAPLTVAAASRDQIRTSMGLGLDQAFDISGMPLALGGFAKLFGIHGDRTSMVSASDGGLSAPGSFAVAGPGSGSVGGEIGAHAALSITSNAAITLSWSSRLANHASDHAGQIGLQIGL